MTQAVKKPNLLVIDRQEDWRNLSVRVLEKAGYDVRALDDYECPPSGRHGFREPDLVILGCTVIGMEERTLMRCILESRHRLLVLSTSLPPTVMRTLFLDGADDVVDKPYNSERLIDIVKEALEAITPRDSYQAVEWRGAS